MSARSSQPKGQGALAVIPARGGSKRIPGKNIRPFLGKPILEYAIRSARNSGVFDQVLVSTDDEQIAAVARAAGAEVPFVRPADIANDTASTAEVLVHALDWYAEQDSYWESLCCLYPTAVFVTPELLQEAAAERERREAPALLSVCHFPYPIQRSVRMNPEGDLSWNWPEHELTRSQDLEEAYHDAGQFYFFPCEAFRQNPRLMPAGAIPFLLDRRKVVDIDTEEDWAVAEQIYKVWHA